jgi:3-oxocholest-4-en-26-oate---CoA ligase
MDAPDAKQCHLGMSTPTLTALDTCTSSERPPVTMTGSSTRSDGSVAPPDDNLGSLMEAVSDAIAQVDPDRVAVVQGGRTRTWPQLDERADRLAGHLRSCGVGPGGRVGIGLYNSVEYLEALLAVFKLRAVPVNVNYRYQAAELEEVAAYTGLTALVFDASLLSAVHDVRPRVRSLRCLVCVGQGDADAVVAYDDALRAPRHERRRRSGSDQIIVLTGGTTGRPKGVVWEHAGVRAVVSSAYGRRGLPVPADTAGIVETARQQVQSGAAPVMLPVSPLMHGTGFFFTLGNLLLGGRVVLMTSRSFDAAEVLSAVQAHGVQELAIVGDAFARPLLAEMRAASQHGSPYDVSTLERVVSSGVRWSPEVQRELLRQGRMVLQDSIASTEGGPYGVSMVGPGDQPVSGRFTLPANARVVTADGADVVPGSGEVGVLASTGALPLGYYEDPKATAEVFRTIDGVRYAVPGDAATVESDGTLTLLGRGNSVVNTGGEKVFVEEVEEALLGHPEVEDAVVVGVPSRRWGSQVTALVRVAAGTHPSPADLSEHVGRTLAGYKRPREVFLVDAIKRTASGKTDRRWAAGTARELSAGGR